MHAREIAKLADIDLQDFRPGVAQSQANNGQSVGKTIHERKTVTLQKMKPDKSAVHGRVMNQEKTIALMTRRFALPVVSPIPKSEPTETCVVETGNPYKLASTTRIAVVRFAVKPCP
jgi:hypothetical protein